MKKRFSVQTLILAGSLLLQLSTLCLHSRGAAGDVDLSFHPDWGVMVWCNAIVVQPDGKVIVAGYSTTDEGLDRSMVVRLNANGSLDSSFNAGTTASDNVYVAAIALQSDGKVLVGQNYGVTRLNSNGSLDSSFNLYAVGGDYTGASSLTVQPDGKVLVGGYAVTRIYDPEGYVDYFYSYFVTRVHANGSRDTSFQPVFGDPLYGGGVPVRALALQPDGKVVVGGTSLHLGTIARLNANGILDGSFNSGTGGIVKSVALQPDGKVLVGGQYIGSGTNRNAIARLNADGSLDSSFNPGTGMGGEIPWVESVVVQADGKVLVGGDFTTVNGTNRNRIARLNANGSLDNSFDPGIGADGVVRSIALQSDGKVFIGGGFFTVNGVVRPCVARLYGDQSAPLSFATWTAGLGLTGAAAAADADPDDDGLRNGLEWILGGDPTMPTNVGRPTASLIGGNIIFTFPRTDLSETPDMTLTVEASPDLVTWPTVFTIGVTTAASSPGVTILENGAAADTITVTIAKGAYPSLFARLKVTIAP